MSEILLEMREINKSFPGVKALHNARLTVKKGEVHALLGENGAGKSTLIKILGGIYQADSGEILIEGEKVRIHNVIDAKNAGISIVHQELFLCNNMTVAQNIYLGEEKKKGLFCDDKAMNEEANKLLESFGIDIKATSYVSDLSIAQQQMVELAKAMSKDAKVIVMDEPTDTLTDKESKKLFEMTQKLKNLGVGIIYISHRLEEIFEIADTVTVFRDGEYIDTKPIESVVYNELVNMLIGREMSEMFATPNNTVGDIVLEARDICSGRRVRDCSFYIRKGEILGFYGLVGSGRTELMRVIFGVDKMDSGSILINGVVKQIKNVADALKNGIQLVPEDRKGQGLILIQSVGFNISFTILDRLFKGIFRNAIEEKEVINDYIKKLGIKTPSALTTVKTLSGGNQQKVVVSKSLATNPRILIMDEPTRGIDVGAKKEIYDIMNKLVEQGVAIILISSEIPEIINMSKRVMVMREGNIVAELTGDKITQENIIIKATGGIN
ncbi:MAG: sugar ABC transporter ATP-binding protein [Thermacetogeniaceae bacterium]